MTSVGTCFRAGIRAAMVLAALASVAGTRVARADPVPPATRPAPELPLSPLPEPPRIEQPAPTKDQLAELDRMLAGIASKSETERSEARKKILETHRDLLPAIARRIDTIAEASDRRAMSKLLDDIRDDARDAVRGAMKSRGEKGPVETPDYLDMLSAHPRPGDTGWESLVRIVSLSRMLAQLGTVEATRELVRIRVRYEFLRRDVQVVLEKLGDRALPALIEAQRHPAEEVGQWARQRLDLMGKAIASETVQIEDQEILADILRAYGRIRDPDAARVVISFANSERAQVRLGARQAVRMMGDVADWQLRDTYENIVGKKPPREWSWERTARELFTEFDRLRLARVYDYFGQGMAAYRGGKLDDAITAFDAVLVRSPEFEHSAQMVAAYVDYARKHLDTAPDRARRALGRARRLVGDDLLTRPVQSLLMTLEAEELLETGVADQILLRRAIELDPQNERAQSLLDRIQRGELEKQTRFNRHVAAGTIGAVALLAIVIILLRRPKTPGKSEPTSSST